MSFAEEVKDELARVCPETAAGEHAEMIALLRMGAVLKITPRGATVEFATHHNPTARKMWQYLKQLGGVSPKVAVRRSTHLRKKNLYTLAVADGKAGLRFLQQEGLWPLTRVNDDARFMTPDERRGYLSGAFLGGGSVNRPQGDYHLEITTRSPVIAEVIVRMWRHFGVHGRTATRKEDTIVYVKDGEQVARLLQVMGADQAYLQFESTRVIKDVRNRVNRVVNCETANLQKTVDAAVKQVRDIETIQRYRPLHTLPPRLREAAELRLAHPEVPLRELVSELDGRITKSGLYHRYRKLAALAEELSAKGEGQA